MGQTQHHQDSCFRQCIKQRIPKTNKIQAAPYYNHQPNYKQNKQQQQREFYNNQQNRQYISNHNGKIELCQAGGLSTTNKDTRESPLNQDQLMEDELILGLESKYSSHKNIMERMGKSRNIRRANTQPNYPSNQQNCHNKQRDTESTNKTNNTMVSNEYKTTLVNKIESIKQRYFQKQHKIYSNYRQSIQIINPSQKQQQQLNSIKIARNKILAKLKQKNNKTNNINISQKISENQLHNLFDVHLSINSFNFKANHQKMKQPEISLKQDKEANRSSSQFQQKIENCQQVFEGKVQFSEQSCSNLFEIKQVDEQYNSKATKFSAVNHMSSFRPKHSLHQQISKCAHSNINNSQKQEPYLSRISLNKVQQQRNISLK